MRRGVMLWLLALLAVSGCGSSRDAAAPTTTAVTTIRAAPGLRVGVVGPIALDVQGVTPRHGTLAQVAGSPLVLVDAQVASSAAVAAAARAHPASHFALVGASARGERVPNLAGIVLQEGDAAYLAGVTAALAAIDEGGADARVAWVGPEERRLAAAFGRGVHAAAPGVAVLHQWSRSVPASCKEAALTGLGRGAVVVMAHGGLCAEAAAVAAHEQNLPALRLADFLLPAVAAGLVARDAAGGFFHGGEDVVFGPETGAVGVRALDPRISVATAARARAAAQDLASGIAAAG
ncbi:MAG: hypothetical protein ACXVQ3_04745 [Gaiellaceae bacterium]